MGTPSPVTNIGDACSICWGSGGVFGFGDTPEYLQVEIEGVEKAPGWIPADGEFYNGIFTLKQGIAACGWLKFWSEDSRSVTVRFFADHTQVRATSTTARLAFASPNSDPCSLVVDNERVTFFTGGTATISWSQ